VLKEYGEEKFAKRIARAIVEQRNKAPLTTTTELAALVEKATPVKDRYKHPATRTFQVVFISIVSWLTLKKCWLR
jgi:16S rRNA (cytosine1402-N4)-methyltransferase